MGFVHDFSAPGFRVLHFLCASGVGIRPFKKFPRGFAQGGWSGSELTEVFLSVDGLSACFPAAQEQWCHKEDPSEEYREEYAHAEKCQSHNCVHKMLNEFTCNY